MKTNCSITFIFKFVFPLLFLTVIVIYLIVFPDIIKLNRFYKYLFNVSFVILFCISILFPMITLKKVLILDDSKIQISNFFKKITLNKNEIESVRNYLFTLLYYIKLKNKTAFGKRIFFIPIFTNLLDNLEHLILESLKSRLVAK